MGTETTNPPAPPPVGPDPYFYGWRMVPRWNGGAGQTWEKVPLTEWDVLHPEEDDFIMHNDAHDRDVHYLRAVFERVTAGRPGVRVLCDHRVLWQLPDLGAHGPDVIVFEGLTGPWDPNRGTFPVQDMGARPLVVVEVTSPSTKYLDLDNKVVEYFRAGVPLYVIAERRDTADGDVSLSVFAYRATPDGFVRVPNGNPNGVWVEPLGLWIKSGDDRLVCLDAAGNRFPNQAELLEQKQTAEAGREAERQRAEAERQRAEAERQRAEAAYAELDAERRRADESARKIAELEAELTRIWAAPKPNTPNS